MDQALAITEPSVYHLGLADYVATYDAMRRFNRERGEDTADQLWLLQHPPVYTLGQAGRMEHLLGPTDIPVLHVDRGGQITYHGPGQVVLYTLLDLRRRVLGVRAAVHLLEQAVIDFLAQLNIQAIRRSGAPGVYIDDAKISALGLRVRNGCCYHGLAFNVDMDLRPFENINPCGYAELKVTSLKNLGIQTSCDAVGKALATQVARRLSLGLE